MAPTSKTWRPAIIRVVPLSQTANEALLRFERGEPALGFWARRECWPPSFEASRPCFRLLLRRFVRSRGGEAPGRESALAAVTRSGKAER
eukprot:4259008-Pleurochrysis_carterae.AAC.1